MGPMAKSPRVEIPRIAFDSFAPLNAASGYECNGPAIRLGGVRVGWMTRDVEATRKAGVSEGYTTRVVGYMVDLLVDGDHPTKALCSREPIFESLAEARDYARGRLLHGAPELEMISDGKGNWIRRQVPVG